MKKDLLCFLSVICVILTLGCMDESPNDFCQKNLEFEFYAQTQGLQDTISINDTIWFHLEIDSIATDLISGEEFDIFEHNDFSTWVLNVDNLDTLNLSAANDFNFHSEIGLAEAQNFTAGILTFLNFADYSGKKIINFGIIPQKSGTYAMGYSYINTQERKGMRIIIPDCSTKVEVNRSTNAEDRAQNNYYFVENSPLIEYQNYPEDSFNKNGGFAFHVRE